MVRVDPLPGPSDAVLDVEQSVESRVVHVGGWLVRLLLLRLLLDINLYLMIRYFKCYIFDHIGSARGFLSY